MPHSTSTSLDSTQYPSSSSRHTNTLITASVTIVYVSSHSSWVAMTPTSPSSPASRLRPSRARAPTTAAANAAHPTGTRQHA